MADRDLELKVKLGLDELRKSVSKAKDEIQGLDKIKAQVLIDVEGESFTRKILDLREQLAELDKQEITPAIAIQKDALIGDIAVIRSQLEGLRELKASIEVDVEFQARDATDFLDSLKADFNRARADFIINPFASSNLRKEADLLQEALRYKSQLAAIREAGFSAEDVARAEKFAQEINRINISKISDPLRGLKQSFKEFFEEVRTGFARELGANVLNSITNGFQGIVAGAQNLASQIFEVGKETESLKQRLAQAVGGESAAADIFKELTKFAADTPLEINEIVNAFISLKQRGIEPTTATLTKLGDLAKAQGKSLQQFVEAVLDAQSGENERLKEFGIQARKAGDQVTFTFNGVSKTVAATNEAIAEALTSFGELPTVIGGMEKASRTIEGRLSTLGDAFRANLITVFDGFQPAISGVITFVSSLTERVNVFLKDAFTGVNLEAKRFADFLNANPEVIDTIARGIAEVAASIASGLLSGAQQLAEFLSQNPKAIQQAVEGLKSFALKTIEVVGGIGQVVQGIISIGKFIGDAIAKASEFGKEFTKINVEVVKLLGLPVPNITEEAFGKPEQIEQIVASAKQAAIGFSNLSGGIASSFTEAFKKVEKQAAAIDTAKILKDFEKANKDAEVAVKTSVTNQIAAVKTLGLARETETRRVAEIERAAADARLLAISAEIIKLEELKARKQIDPADADDRLLALNNELASAQLARIEKVRAAENALRAEIIAGIDEQARKQKVADNDRIASQEKVITSLRSAQELANAQSGLEAAQDNLAKARLENQLKIAEAVGNEKQARSLKLQIQQQEAAAQERAFASQLKSLELTQQIKAAELERQKILDQIAITESEIALAKLNLKEGVTAGEIAAQEQLVSLNRQKLATTENAIAQSGQLNDLAKQEVLARQQAAREAQIVAAAIEIYNQNQAKTNATVKQGATDVNAIATAYASVNQNAIELNTTTASVNKTLSETPEVVKLADGSIVSVNTKLKDSAKTIDDLNKKFGGTSEVIKLADGSIVSLNEEIGKAVTDADTLDVAFGNIPETAKKIGEELKTGLNESTTAAESFAAAVAKVLANMKAAAEAAPRLNQFGEENLIGSPGYNRNLTQQGQLGSDAGSTFAQKEAAALAQTIADPFEKQAFLFAARAKELKDAGGINNQKVNIGGAEFDFKEAASLFGQAASTELNGLVSKFAKSVIGQKIAVAQVGQVVSGNSLEKILQNTNRILRERATGRLESIPIEIEGFASGTRGKPIGMGSIALVGENGPELIMPTSKGTHVLSNGESKRFAGAFAEGTGSLSDFYTAQAIKTKSAIADLLSDLNRFGDSGTGFSFKGSFDIGFAMAAVAGMRQLVDDVASQLAKGDIMTAKANFEQYQKAESKVSNNYGIYKREVNAALASVARLFTVRPYQSDMSFVGNAGNFRMQPQSSNNSTSTSIGTVNISAPDPTGEAARFIHMDSVQKMKAAKL